MFRDGLLAQCFVGVELSKFRWAFAIFVDVVATGTNFVELARLIFFVFRLRWTYTILVSELRFQSARGSPVGSSQFFCLGGVRGKMLS